MTKRLISTISLSALAFASLGLVACEKKDKDAPTKEAQPTEPTKEEAKPAVEAPTQAPAQAADPGTLKTIMAGIADEMTTAQLGLWTENFDLIATSAMKVADHPKVSDTEKARVVKALGEDMPAFGAMDKMVHGTAVKLAEAANKKDLQASLTELAALQKACVTCHTTFRSRLVVKE